MSIVLDIANLSKKTLDNIPKGTLPFGLYGVSESSTAKNDLRMYIVTSFLYTNETKKQVSFTFGNVCFEGVITVSRPIMLPEWLFRLLLDLYSINTITEMTDGNLDGDFNSCTRTKQEVIGLCSAGGE